MVNPDVARPSKPAGVAFSGRRRKSRLNFEGGGDFKHTSSRIHVARIWFLGHEKLAAPTEIECQVDAAARCFGYSARA